MKNPRLRPLLLAALLVVGCNDAGPRRAPPDAAPPLPDAAPADAARPDARPPDAAPPDAAPPDAAPPDAAPPDAAPPDAAPPDAAMDAAPDAAAPDAAPDATPDAALPPPVPDFQQVGLATLADVAHVAWPTADRLLLRTLGPDAAWTGPPRELAALEAPPVGVFGAVLGDVPFIAWAPADDAPIRLVRADRPEEPVPALEVRGAPLLTTIGRRLVVVGRVPGPGGATDLAWQLVERVRDAWTASAPIVVPGPIRSPDDVAALVGSALLRGGGDGYCIQIGDDGQPLGFVPCFFAEGRLVAGERNAYVLHVDERENDVVRVSPVFGNSPQPPFLLGLPSPVGPQRFPSTNRGVPVVVAGNEGERVNRNYLAVVGAEMVWRAKPPDVHEQGWPFPDARAVVPRGEIAHLLRFGTPDDPALAPQAMQGFPPGGTFPFSFGDERLRRCTPRPETCNFRDDDCDAEPDENDYDGLIDEGVCCVSAPRPRRIADYAGRATELLVADTDRDAVRFAVRDEAGRWKAFSLVHGVDEVYPLLDVAAGRGVALVAVGRATLLLTRGVVDLEARWSYPDEPHDPLKETRILPCSDALSVDRVGPGDATDRVVVVCRDRILRLSPWADVPDVEDRELMPEVGAAWVTTMFTNVPSLARLVLLGFRGQFGDEYVLRLLRVPPEGRITEELVPDELARIPGEDWAQPLWARAPTAAAPARWGLTYQAPAGRRPRVWMPGVSDFAWRDVVTGPYPDRIDYAPGTGRVYSARREGDRLVFWTFGTRHIGGSPAGYQVDRVAVWTFEPAFTVEAEGTLWALHRGDDLRDIVITTPDPAGGLRVYTPLPACIPLRY